MTKVLSTTRIKEANWELQCALQYMLECFATEHLNGSQLRSIYFKNIYNFDEVKISMKLKSCARHLWEISNRAWCTDQFRACTRSTDCVSDRWAKYCWGLHSRICRNRVPRVPRPKRWRLHSPTPQPATTSTRRFAASFSRNSTRLDTISWSTSTPFPGPFSYLYQTYNSFAIHPSVQSRERSITSVWRERSLNESDFLITGR